MGNADNHASKRDKVQAKLERSQTYRTNGYNHIRGNGGKRKQYGDLERVQGVLLERGTKPSKPKVAQGSVAHARRYTFTHNVNFRIGAAPYVNQGHHLVPCDAFGDKYFNLDQRELLLRVRYDVNNGKNIIFLPTRARDCQFHNLPQHNGSHPGYTNLVDTDMSAVKQSLDKAIKKDPEHKKYSASDIRKRLMALQDDYWDYLTNCGGIPVNGFKKPTVGKLGKES